VSRRSLATRPRLGFRLPAVGALVLLVAACGDQAVNPTTKPPYASPALSAPAAVASRSCDAVRANSLPSGIEAAQVLVIRQGTDLQRVSDTLTGAVPGGDFRVDAGLAFKDAGDLRDGLAASNLCEPARSALVAKAQVLKDADQFLVSTGGGAGAAAALQAAQDALTALRNLVQNPPPA
jgi:hypothetical protein